MATDSLQRGFNKCVKKSSLEIGVSTYLNSFRAMNSTTSIWACNAMDVDTKISQFKLLTIPLSANLSSFLPDTQKG